MAAVLIAPIWADPILLMMGSVSAATWAAPSVATAAVDRPTTLVVVSDATSSVVSALIWTEVSAPIWPELNVLISSEVRPGIAALLDTFDEVTSQGSMAQAVAAFYVYEAQVPEIAAQKISGLRRFYDITEPRALAYFSVHQEADVRHRAAWRSWLKNQNQEDNFEVLCAAERSLKALWGALDAVYPQSCAAKN